MKTSFIIIWFLSVTFAFVLGYSLGIGERYESVEKVVLFDYSQQLKEAIRDGVPFKLKGSDINLLPRSDGQICVSAVRLEKDINKVGQTSE
ncbi:MAG: hypothetical protein ACLPN1_16545 [Dissulfurispiraceae bacterium]|jgi:hypothetical protein